VQYVIQQETRNQTTNYEEHGVTAKDPYQCYPRSAALVTSLVLGRQLGPILSAQGYQAR
jgi:hypothetical protein